MSIMCGGSLSQSKVENKATESKPNEAGFTYGEALLKDAGSIDTLMSTEGIFDNDKIVILPNKFRKGSIESAIKVERFFVARNDDEVVGYKKLFVLTDAEERKEMLTDEIRCLKGPLVDGYSISSKNRCKLLDPAQTYGVNDIYIYDGADFTKNAFRGKGINSELTKRAFEHIKEDVKKLINEKRAERIILVYGLTHLNDYDEKGEGKSRTPSIVGSFSSFAHTLTGIYPEEVKHFRYKAFMPTFDLDNQECKPRPDSDAIPGYGNVLIINLPQT